MTLCNPAGVEPRIGIPLCLTRLYPCGAQMGNAGIVEIHNLGRGGSVPSQERSPLSCQGCLQPPSCEPCPPATGFRLSGNCILPAGMERMETRISALAAPSANLGLSSCLRTALSVHTLFHIDLLSLDAYIAYGWILVIFLCSDNTEFGIMPPPYREWSAIHT